jgi:hypothetical protein
MRGDKNFTISCPIIISADEINACQSGDAIMAIIEARAVVAKISVSLLVDQYLAKRASRSKE